MKCPSCGKVIFNANVAELPSQARQMGSAIDDVIQVGGVMILMSCACYVILWHAGIGSMWVAPTVGLISGVGVVAAKLVPNINIPVKKPNLGVVVDVRARGDGTTKWYLDTFPEIRIDQLRVFCESTVAPDSNVSRRRLKKCGVTEGQYQKISQVLIDKGWLDVSGNVVNGQRSVNVVGRRVLRGVLNELESR